MSFDGANVTGSSANTSDATFIYRVRQQMEDLPRFELETVTANGSQTEYQCTRAPIYDGDPYSPATGAINFSITVGSTLQTLVASPEDLTAVNEVAVDYETGWVYWHPSYPPPAATITFRKRSVRWRDQRILEALKAGMKAMFPIVGQDQYDTSITMQVNKWEYALPNVFWDPRVRFTSVELQEIPAQLERFYPVSWSRKTLTAIEIPASQGYTPGAVLRIRYWGPYQVLGDLEPQLEQLPIHYAKALLVSNKEIPRVRQDTGNVTTQEVANPVGASTNAGAYFMSQFRTELLQMQRVLPVAPPVTTYGTR